MAYCARNVLPNLARLSLPIALIIACCGLAAAAEPEKSACSAFCTPVTAGQLDLYRAQGLAKPAGDTAVGVILWDEYRRVRTAPGDAVPTNGVAVPGGTAFVSTASTLR
jgi:hypothetical protein